MGYQSKTYSLSDEVVTVLDSRRALGVTPNQFITWMMRDLGYLEKDDSVPRVIANAVKEQRSTDSSTLDAVGIEKDSTKGKASLESWRRGPREKGILSGERRT